MSLYLLFFPYVPCTSAGVLLLMDHHSQQSSGWECSQGRLQRFNQFLFQENTVQKLRCCPMQGTVSMYIFHVGMMDHHSQQSSRWECSHGRLQRLIQFLFQADPGQKLRCCVELPVRIITGAAG